MMPNRDSRLARAARTVAAALAALAAAGSLYAQTPASPTDSLNDLQFRNLGPSVAGGRVAAVAGVPGDPQTYYVGAAGGGVWKTSDGGATWKDVFADEPVASIGAIALAPSDPSLVWVGTGEANVRNDALNGHGIYFSPDAGQTWQPMGLTDVGQIARVVIDPTNPDVVLVAALGHAWTPNPDRGIYKTTDGGKTWQKVLFVNDSTGAIDLAMEPGNPRVLLAAMWQVQRFPWELDDGGPASAIYRSTDGGATWTRLTTDMPPGPLGRIALAFAPTAPSHVYALIEAKTGMLWESSDLGDHWTSVSDNHALDVRPFYFSQVNVAPDDDQKLYFSSYQLLESDDGGHTARVIDRPVHVDHHALWIDPTNAKRMIQGNDGGAWVTQNGGATWDALNNLPIGQFYMVALDDNHPFTVCGGLQDNNGWCGPSDARGETGTDWFTVAGGDGQYIVPAPSDSTIIYAESQNGDIERMDMRTGTRRGVRPTDDDVGDAAPSQLKYRYNWTTPIAVSYTDPNEVLLGANVVFKTTDGGTTWTPISPDLTRHDPAHERTSGGPIQYDISGAETYNTILSITIAPSDSNVIWVGTDDGYIWVTRDGGAHWTNTTSHLPKLPQPEGGRIAQVGVSPRDPGTAYIAVDYHEYDDNRPYVFKTANYGQSWTDISRGLPDFGAAHVVREDPNQPGFLVLGTDNALYYSRDAGATWIRFGGGFPTAPVYDVQFAKQEHDLVVATHGRGLFVLDNITPLEETTSEVAAAPFHLFSVLPATIQAGGRRRGPDASDLAVPPAPSGAMVDYFIKSPADTTHHGGGEAGGEGAREAERGGGGFGGARSARGGHHVVVTVTDAAGDTVSTDSTTGKMGYNRYEWNLRYNGATRLDFERGGAGGGGFFRGGFGPRAVPGTYTITVSMGRDRQSQQVRVLADPKVPADSAAFAVQLAASLDVRAKLSALNTMLNRISSLQDQLKNVHAALKNADHADARPVLASADALGRKLSTLKDSLYNSDVQRGAPEDDIHYLSRFQSRFNGVVFGVMGPYAEPPRPAVREELAALTAQLNAYLDQFNAILAGDVAAYNRLADEHHAPELVGGGPVTIESK